MGKEKKEWKTVLWIVVAVIVVLAAAVLAINGMVIHKTKDCILPDGELALPEKVDCVLVLGCGVLPDGTPTAMLQDRVDTGIRAYRAGASDKLLLSGDHGSDTYNELGAMKGITQAEGIDEDAVFCDHAGFSTYESIYRGRDVFQVKRVIIVTQRYHLYRSLYIAQKMGLEAYGIPADCRPYAGQIFREIREIAARCKDSLYCLIKPEPTYLGEPVPITGKGRETNG